MSLNFPTDVTIGQDADYNTGQFNESLTPEALRKSPQRRARLEDYANNHAPPGIEIEVRLLSGIDTACAINTDTATAPENAPDGIDFKEFANTEADFLLLITSNKMPIPLEDTPFENQEVLDYAIQCAFTLHEIAHVLYTDFGEYSDICGEYLDTEDTQKAKSFKHFTNGFEDGAIERAIRLPMTERVPSRQKLVNHYLRLPGEYMNVGWLDAVEIASIDLPIYDTHTIKSLLDPTNEDYTFANKEDRALFIDLLPQLRTLRNEVLQTPIPSERYRLLASFWKTTIDPLIEEQKKSSNSDQQSQQDGQSDSRHGGEGDEGDRNAQENNGGGGSKGESPPQEEDASQAPDGLREESQPDAPNQQDGPTGSESNVEGQGHKEEKPSQSDTDLQISPSEHFPDDLERATALTERSSSTGPDTDALPAPETPSDGESGEKEAPQLSPSTTHSENDSDSDSDHTDSEPATPQGDQNPTGQPSDDIAPENSDEQSNEGENATEPTENTSSGANQTNLADFDEIKPSEQTDPDQTSSSTKEGTDQATQSPVATESGAEAEQEAEKTPGEPEPTENVPVPGSSREQPNLSEEYVEEETEATNDQSSQSPPPQFEDEISVLEGLMGDGSGDGSGTGGLDQSEIELLPTVPQSPQMQEQWNQAMRNKEITGGYLQDALKNSQRSDQQRGRRSGAFDSGRAQAYAAGRMSAFKQRSPGTKRKYTLIIVLDRSGSMSETEIKAAETAVAQFALAAEDIGIKVSIIDFYNDEIRVLTPFHVPVEETASSIIQNKMGGTTPLSDVLTFARERVQREAISNWHPIMLVVTDGRPNNLDQYLEELRHTQQTVSSIFGLTIAPSIDAQSPPKEYQDQELYFSAHEFVTSLDPKSISRKLEELTLKAKTLVK